MTISDGISNSLFNTIKYCIDNNIPCFTFKMNKAKKVNVVWKNITSDNMIDYINFEDNGFAVITGAEYIVIDYDEKHNPPKSILTILIDNCNAVEKTPGGYHFWYKTDKRTGHFKSGVNIKWNNSEVVGLDIRAKGGIIYTSPSYYYDGDIIKKYSWIKGDLSTATPMPSLILEYLTASDSYDTSCNVIVNTPDKNVDNIDSCNSSIEYDWSDIIKLVNMLSEERASNYDTWRDVIFCIRNIEYSERALELCHSFSKKCLQKYSEKEVNSKFKSGFNHMADSGTKKLTISSLYFWAKNDSHDEFTKLKLEQNYVWNMLISCIHANIAELFYNSNPNRYLYSSNDGWYILQNNNVWKATGSKEIKSIPNLLNCISTVCRDLLYFETEKRFRIGEKSSVYSSHTDSMHKIYKETHDKLGTSSFLRGVIDFLQGLYYVHDVEKKFNMNKDLFAFNNCVYNINTKEFRDIMPSDYITITCGYDYKKASEYDVDKVKAFLKQIFPCDHVYNYVICALSRSLSGYSTDQTFHICSGVGANGKSCLMDLCKKAFGNYYQTISSSYFTKESEGKDRPLPELAEAKYARILVSSEPDSKDRFQINLIKHITGSEEVSFRGMYAKQPTIYVPQFKLWILTNDIPKFTKYDLAIERRTRCIPFDTRFVYEPVADNEVKRDDNLTLSFDRDDSWKLGLIELLISSLDNAKNIVLHPPPKIIECTQKYLLENNPVGAWLNTYYNITGNDNDHILKSELYEAYVNDMIADDKQYVNSMNFFKVIVKCNVIIKQLADGKRYYLGLTRK